MMSSGVAFLFSLFVDPRFSFFPSGWIRNAPVYVREYIEIKSVIEQMDGKLA